MAYPSEFDKDPNLVKTKTFYPDITHSQVAEISSILRKLKLESPEEEEARKIEKDEADGDKKNIFFTHSLLNFVFLILDALVRICSSFSLIAALFVNIPLQFKYKGCSQRDFLSAYSLGGECNHKWVYIGANISATILLLILLTEVFPHFKKIPGFNSLDDRTPFSFRLASYFGVHRDFGVLFIRCFLIVVLIFESIGFPLYRDFIFWSGILMLCYYMLGAVLNFILKQFDLPTIQIASFHSLKKDSETSDDKPEKDEHLKGKKKLAITFRAISICYFLACFIMNILTLSYSNNLFTPKLLIILVIVTYAFVMIIYAFEVYELRNNQLVINPNIGYLIGICFFYCGNRTNEFIPFPKLVRYIFLFLTLGYLVFTFGFTFFLRRKTEKKENLDEHIKKYKINIYIFIFSLALMFTTILFYIVDLELEIENSNFKFFGDIISHFVNWCYSNIKEEEKSLLYNLNLTDNEIMIKIIFISYFAPILVIFIGVVYYLLPERRSLLQRDKLLFIPYILFPLLAFSNIFIDILNHIVEENWDWKGVVESRIRINDISYYSQINDVCIVGVFCMFCIYYEADHDRDHVETSEVIQDVSSTNSAEDDKKGFRLHKEQFINHFLSILLSIGIIYNFFHHTISTGSFLTISPMKFGHSANFSQNLLDNDVCDSEVADNIFKLANDLKASLDEIKLYNHHVKFNHELFDTKLTRILFATPPLICLATLLFTNVGCIVSTSAQKKSLTITIVCLTLSIPCLFFGISIYVMAYFFTYSLIYPFNDVVYSSNFLTVVYLNSVCFIPMLISLVENFITPFPVNSKKGIVTEDANGSY